MYKNNYIYKIYKLNMTNIIGTQIKLLKNTYSNFSTWGKVLFFASLLIICLFLLSGFNKMKEGFEQSDQFLFKTGNDVYDDFYADIYDYLVFSNQKDEYEVGEIVNKTTPTSHSRILDVGSGTGHHVAGLASRGFDVLGIDISPSMVKKAKKDFPQYKFEVGDATNSGEFGPNSFTHIMCMYFTIYYIQDKIQFFRNAMKWLKPGGYLILHLVDRDQFDPILPPGNPLLYVSPQRYAQKRITSTKVKFDDFRYSAEFKLNPDTNIAIFEEKFKNDSDGKVRKNEHVMYMPKLDNIVADAQQQGFILDSKVDLLNIQYEYQYLYIFIKPE
jgi:SAM-dependent methyltransferase